ncbi:MAG: TIGR03619 family F420-dependent LLM class oxidoreductase, partial [Novosphingobium sp.]|nr:TIGR03619 family F420-dependent LLM class oxidoreductase [Novosphingobium sp.]
MKLTFGIPNMCQAKAIFSPWEEKVTGAEQTKFAKWAEKLGYEMICVPEHHIIPSAHVELSGPHYFNAYVGMAHFAGATETIRVNSCIAILPTQNPIITAKALSTMDWLSSGRVTVTFAVGWLEEEFDLLGVDFNKRGAMSEEYTQAIIELWTKEKPEFEGKYVSFKDVAFEPKPVQKPHIPIWFGGDVDAVLKRTARYASGWWPFLTRPDQIAMPCASLDTGHSRRDFLRDPLGVVVILLDLGDFRRRNTAPVHPLLCQPAKLVDQFLFGRVALRHRFVEHDMAFADLAGRHAVKHIFQLATVVGLGLDEIDTAGDLVGPGQER